MVPGAALGGGERGADLHGLLDRRGRVPAHAHYVALGHLHRTQQIGGAAPIWYSGSPIQVDFGDTDRQAVVLIVEATPVDAGAVA